jgi:phosphate starvation-inducible protein PhoH and related proteins
MSGLKLLTQDEAQLVSGPHDSYLHMVRKQFGVDIVIRDLHVVVSGEDTERRAAAARLLGVLVARARSEGSLSQDEVEALLADAALGRKSGEAPCSLQGARLRTDGQRSYVGKIEGHDLVFAIGPAGTGKTFLAVLMAVKALKAGAVERIVLCRPAVEAGENLGFLPGDLQAKVNPYMRPLYDALYTVLDFETVKRYMEREVIEVAPLAYMRGRTLNRAFVILDEAQNTTIPQMKMFLTRMGEQSKIVVTGDITQIDLPPKTKSGLTHAQQILSSTQGIAFATLTHADIVRHPLVNRIIRAYDSEH